MKQSFFTTLKLSRFIFITLCIGVLASITSSIASELPKVRHGYTESSYGELHYAISEPVGAVVDKTPIILFHQTSNSSVEFGNLIPELGRDRVTIGMDTPGYGNSDGPEEIPTIADYADAMAGSLVKMGYGRDKPVDLLGSKTGAFVAIEIAVRHPEIVRKVVLVGVWVVSEEERLKAVASIPKLNNSVEFFNYVVNSMPRWINSPYREYFNDDDWGKVRIASLMATYRREYGHYAAFEYATKLREQLQKMNQQVLLVIPGNEMRKQTLEAMNYVKNGYLADLPELKPGYYFYSAPQFATPVRKFLDNEQ